MCRFSGPLDKEYQKVVSALQRIIMTAGRRRPTGTGTPGREHKSAPHPTLQEDALRTQLRDLVSSLKFDGIDDRYSTIELPHSKTCEWLLSIPEYMSWVNATVSCPNNFLWIKGKPGSGKSTIMKFAHSQAKQVARDAILIHFFFNARGADLEKSTLGLYRSILYQLFRAVPDLQSILATVWVASGDPGHDVEWRIGTLKEVFSSALNGVRGRPVLCYIDALDEGDEDEVRDMISFFLRAEEEAAAAGVHFSVCLSSLTIRRGVSFRLERQEQHYQDIATYVDSKVYIGDDDRAVEVRQRVQEKASGIFLWAVLVVGILNREYDRGNMAALQRRLDEAPEDLSNLFKDILTRDVENLEEMWMCIQCVLFARAPLTRQELYFAIISGTNPSNLATWDRKVMSEGAINRYILNISKGLTEIASKSFKVHFIHVSVCDFLIKENGLGRLWPQFLNNFEGGSQDKLRRCCEAQLRSIPDADPVGPEWQPSYPCKSSKLQNSYPSVWNVFYHANLAQASGMSQLSFLKDFDLAGWVTLSNAFQRHDIRRHSNEVTILYILAEQDHHHLVGIHPHLAPDYMAPTR